ncbi:SDR family NAD(P)-dependent oxidoreductase [Nocardia sp. NPDC057272]|uniref:SDR family NAD(P)-dependent oxidoreductase n=1 Tax=Nocardia sp. NPDC057272 TaxID=3346079 RepID=UPI00363072E1
MTHRRCALITGGSRGIGAEVARRLAELGYDLTLAARDGAVLDSTAEELRTDHGVDVVTVIANMNDPEQLLRLADTHADRFGRLDVLVHCAGTGTAGPVATMSAAGYHRMFDINVRGPLTLVQHCLPLLRETAKDNPGAGAKIVALASITGVAGEPGLAAYGASKAALVSLCETISLEESANGVSATAISPGYVDTDMTAWKRDELDRAAMLTTGDIAELVLAITRLSANAVVPNIVVSRSGNRLWRA